MAPFETVGQSVVSRMAIPRKGDTIKIKYNFSNPAEFVVMPWLHTA